jgi:hypothetical protein
MVKSSEPENFVVPENYKQPEDYSIPKIDELSNEDEEILEKNLVWIFAFPRSGTQWLGTQLLRYGTQIVHGPSIGVPLGALHDDFTDNYVRQIDFRKEEAGYFFSDLYRDTWNFYLRKLILNRIYAQVRNLESKIILPDPEGSMAADIISECLPNSKIIILFRDGRDSIDSRLDSLGTNSWYVKNWKVTPISEETRMAKIYHLAKKWEIQMKILIKTLEKHPTKNSLPVKYEDLRNNTLKTLQQIYEFIGIKIPTENIKELIRLYEFENIPKEKRGPDQVTRFASPGIWKEHFNAGEIDMIEKIIGKTLRKIGYK